MDKILFVNACVRPDSRTYELAQHVLPKLDGQAEEFRHYECRQKPLTRHLPDSRKEQSI